MRFVPFLALLAIAACADNAVAPTTEGNGGGPMLSAGTCGISDSLLSPNPLSADANSSGNSNASWHLWKSNGVGVTIIGQSFTYSGQVTGASNSNWAPFPYSLTGLIDADLLYSTGAAGSGTVGLSLQYVCADGGDTLTKSFKRMGIYSVTVN